jgi:hypothetical protein
MKELDLADARHEFTILLRAQVNKEAALAGRRRPAKYLSLSGSMSV